MDEVEKKEKFYKDLQEVKISFLNISTKTAIF